MGSIGVVIIKGHLEQRFIPPESIQLCPKALPLVALQRLHICGRVQVAAAQAWPNGLPEVVPHRVHFLATVQVAVVKL